MERLTRWGPVVIAFGTLLAIHTWLVVSLLNGTLPLLNGLPIKAAILASLRDLPSTVLMLLPAWLPFAVPPRMARLSGWATVICGAVSLGVAISFAVVVALRQEKFFLAVAALYASVGLLHLGHRFASAPNVAASGHNGT